jgi:hypothetical protein
LGDSPKTGFRHEREAQNCVARVLVRVIVIVHECDLVGLGLDSGPILGNPDRDWDNTAISKM